MNFMRRWRCPECGFRTWILVTKTNASREKLEFEHVHKGRHCATWLVRVGGTGSTADQVVSDVVAAPGLTDNEVRKGAGDAIAKHGRRGRRRVDSPRSRRALIG
jgi:hypothetical protein